MGSPYRGQGLVRIHDLPPPLKGLADYRIQAPHGPREITSATPLSFLDSLNTEMNTNSRALVWMLG